MLKITHRQLSNPDFYKRGNEYNISNKNRWKKNLRGTLRGRLLIQMVINSLQGYITALSTIACCGEIEFKATKKGWDVKGTITTFNKKDMGLIEEWRNHFERLADQLNNSEVSRFGVRISSTFTLTHVRFDGDSHDTPFSELE